LYQGKEASKSNVCERGFGGEVLLQAMRNGHMVLRQMLSTLAMGATWFRADNTIPYSNPLYLRNDTRNSTLALGNGYRQGVAPFLKLVERGVWPIVTNRSLLLGISPVARDDYFDCNLVALRFI
jgi:hypothetical protein